MTWLAQVVSRRPDGQMALPAPIAIQDQVASGCLDLPPVSTSVNPDVRDRDGTQSYAFLITHELQPALAGDTALEGFVPRPTRGAGSRRRDRICG